MFEKKNTLRAVSARNANSKSANFNINGRRAINVCIFFSFYNFSSVYFVHFCDKFIVDQSRNCVNIVCTRKESNIIEKNQCNKCFFGLVIAKPPVCVIDIAKRNAFVFWRSRIFGCCCGIFQSQFVLFFFVLRTKRHKNGLCC